MGMKKLDDEYKKACAEETPDLWNRIEAGLPQKTEQTMSHREPPEAAPAQDAGTQSEAAGTTWDMISIPSICKSGN